MARQLAVPVLWGAAGWRSYFGVAIWLKLATEFCRRPVPYGREG
jgi:hypothetical protein